jgi:hypothetical protein
MGEAAGVRLFVGNSSGAVGVTDTWEDPEAG